MLVHQRVVLSRRACELNLAQHEASIHDGIAGAQDRLVSPIRAPVRRHMLNHH